MNRHKSRKTAKFVPIEDLAFKHVYAKMSDTQYLLAMRRRFGNAETLTAVRNAKTIKRMINPNT